MSEALMKRRGTIAEEATEGLLDAKKKEKEAKIVKKKTFKQRLGEIGQEIYNKEYREFLGRDAKAWFKLSLFYFIFYLILAGFFILMLYIFFLMLDKKVPTYFNKKSVMNYAGVNPGLGFRPQIDPENDLIVISEAESSKYIRSLELFLEKYDNHSTFIANGKEVHFEYRKIIENTPCSVENKFGFNTPNPCILVKLNKIYDWKPVTGDAPYPLKADAKDKHVYIACEGDTSVDKDNLGEVDYYSLYPGKEIGGIPFKFFPYKNQDNYLSPLVFVHFKGISENTLVNVECKAYAKNIDNTDRLNKRGMTKFGLFIKKKKQN